MRKLFTEAEEVTATPKTSVSRSPLRAQKAGPTLSRHDLSRDLSPSLRSCCTIATMTASGGYDNRVEPIFIELQLIIEPREASLIEADRPLRYIPDCKKGVTMTNASVGGSAEVEVYANWALIMVRMTYALVGADPWTVVQNKIHPGVAEPEFTPLDLSCMSR